VRQGEDVTIVASSYMTVEACRAAETLQKLGVEAEVIDLRTLTPLNMEVIFESVIRTGRLIVCDQGTRTGGFAAEIICRVAEASGVALKTESRRITLPDEPVPSSRALANYYYPQSDHIVAAALEMNGHAAIDAWSKITPEDPLDLVDPTFRFRF